MNLEQTDNKKRREPLLSDGERETIHKEIDLVQSVINRMAHNSFLVKGWCLSVLAVSVPLSSHVKNGLPLFVLLLPISFFWYLDAYYLRLERAYRCFYAELRNKRLSNNWSDAYDLDCEKHLLSQQPVFRTMLSKSLSLFYGILLMSLIVVVLLTSL